MSDARWDDPREYDARGRSDEWPRVYEPRDRDEHDPREPLMRDLDLPRGDGRELVISFRTSISRSRSATIFFSRPFSCYCSVGLSDQRRLDGSTRKVVSYA